MYFIDKIRLLFNNKNYIVSGDAKTYIKIVFRCGDSYRMEGWWVGSIFCVPENSFIGSSGPSSKTLVDLAKIINGDPESKFRIKIKH